MHMENRLFPPAKLLRHPQRGVSVPVPIARARHLHAHSSRCRKLPWLVQQGCSAASRPGSSATDTALELRGRRVVYISSCKQHGLLLLAY